MEIHEYPKYREYKGRKVRAYLLDEAVPEEDGTLSVILFENGNDPMKLHFDKDGTVLCIAGYGAWTTRTTDGKETTRYEFADIYDYVAIPRIEGLLLPEGNCPARVEI